MERPNPVAVTSAEGEGWRPWVEFSLQSRERNPPAVHSVKFDDGSIFDTVNGWRRSAKSNETGV